LENHRSLGHFAPDRNRGAAELHIYAKGGHGCGMKKSGLPAADWIVRVGEWMRSMGLLTTG